jgi:hypothetical protein
MIGDNLFRLNMTAYPAGSYVVQIKDELGESHS